MIGNLMALNLRSHHLIANHDVFVFIIYYVVMMHNLQLPSVHWSYNYMRELKKKRGIMRKFMEDSAT